MLREVKSDEAPYGDSSLLAPRRTVRASFLSPNIQGSSQPPLPADHEFELNPAVGPRSKPIAFCGEVVGMCRLPNSLPAPRLSPIGLRPEPSLPSLLSGEASAEMPRLASSLPTRDILSRRMMVPVSQLKLEVALRPLKPELPDTPASPAARSPPSLDPVPPPEPAPVAPAPPEKKQAWRPKNRRAVKPPEPLHRAHFTPSNRVFDSYDEYREGTKDIRKKIVLRGTQQGKNMTGLRNIPHTPRRSLEGVPRGFPPEERRSPTDAASEGFPSEKPPVSPTSPDNLTDHYPFFHAISPTSPERKRPPPIATETTGKGDTDGTHYGDVKPAKWREGSTHAQHEGCLSPENSTAPSRTSGHHHVVRPEVLDITPVENVKSKYWYSVHLPLSDSSGTYKCGKGDMVIRVTPKRTLHTRGAWQAVFTEVVVLRALDSEHCVRYVDALHTKDELFVVMKPAMEGGLLRVLDVTCLTHRVVRSVLRQVLSALTHLHSLNVAYCGMHPDNILATRGEDGLSVRLTNFRRARYVGCQTDSTPIATSLVRMTEAVGGSPPHHGFAPKETLARDVVCAGALLHLLVCGTAPLNSTRSTLLPNTELVFVGLPQNLELLIGNLLAPPPKAPSSREALQHPWLSSNEGDEGTSFTPTTSHTEWAQAARDDFDVILTTLYGH